MSERGNGCPVGMAIDLDAGKQNQNQKVEKKIKIKNQRRHTTEIRQ
jgi:hypothetical protein